ncbi:MAG TPA: hypothetical protein PLV13_06550 [Ilumatobacteraceae bacterium]|nr:hypothetical protein [Ilumatobacteraceae bacterium]
MIRWRLRRRAAGSAAPDGRPRDEGMALVFAMVFMIMATALILPLLSYTRTVMKAANDEDRKIARVSATTGAMRLALAEPIKLYQACAEKAGLHVAFPLAVPDVGTPVEVECYTINQASELDGSEIRVAMTTVAAGSVAPDGTVGDPYVNNGSLDPHQWWNDATTASQGGSIWLPYLPTHALNHPASSGYMMPSWAGNCRVFFPGTYSDPITITDNIPTYFTSGVYYFEGTVTFGANANVVVGLGAAEGCTTDSEAALYAINAPLNISISGVGGTFILGGAGRLVVTDQGSSNAPTVQFNARLVDPTDVGHTVSQGVSIISVNGTALTTTASTDMVEPAYLEVPKSMTENNPTDTTAPVDAASTGYRPSTLVQTSLADATPIIEVNFTGGGSSVFFVPGYIAVPQGRISINADVGFGSGKTVQLLGAVLAAKVTRTGEIPALLELGFVNRVVQKTFKIVARTPESLGTPYVVSVAIVQVNDYGEYAVNSWVTNS